MIKPVVDVLIHPHWSLLYTAYT